MSPADGVVLDADEARALLELAGRTPPRTGDELRLLAALTLAVVDLDSPNPPTPEPNP